MKVRIINHVNYIEYTDIEVKDKTELDKFLEFENGFDEGIDWIHGKDYGETTYEILDEEVK